MTLVEAVEAIITDAMFPANKRRNRKHMLKVEKACAVIGLSTADSIRILKRLEYVGSDGQTYTCFLPESQK